MAVSEINGGCQRTAKNGFGSNQALYCSASNAAHLRDGRNLKTSHELETLELAMPDKLTHVVHLSPIGNRVVIRTES